MQAIKRIVLLFLLGSLFSCQSNGEKEASSSSSGATSFSEELLSAVFEESGVNGTIVLLDANSGQRYIHNPERAREEFLPASTFKIPNTLIALETGVTNETETFTWDGTERTIEAWNRDQTLSSAFRNSVVWVYQDLARRVGEEEMQLRVDYLGYGNSDISGGIDQFWLSGGLRISAIDQVQFLQRMIAGNLPLKPGIVQKALPIFLEEETETYKLYAKTGWATIPEPDLGWYVGWIETVDQRFLFALNINIEDVSQIGNRQKLVREILRRGGLITQVQSR
ncbi:MAG: class D beta-lactamase [Bacteroidota bacterium]